MPRGERPLDEGNGPLVEFAQVTVEPMSTDDLRRAVIGPAVVETALVARIVADAAGQPGVLPLLSPVLMASSRHDADLEEL